MAAIVLFMMLVMLGVGIYIATAVFGDLLHFGAEFLRQLRQNPRFGMRTLLVMTAVWACSFGLARLLGVDGPEATIWAVLLLPFALAIVLSVQFVAQEHGEIWARKRARINLERPEFTFLDSAADRGGMNADVASSEENAAGATEEPVAAELVADSEPDVVGLDPPAIPPAPETPQGN